jgi:hypothetical protein
MVGQTDPMAMSDKESGAPTATPTPSPSAISTGDVMSPVVTPPESQPTFTYFSLLKRVSRITSA